MGTPTTFDQRIDTLVEKIEGLLESFTELRYEALQELSEILKDGRVSAELRARSATMVLQNSARDARDLQAAHQVLRDAIRRRRGPAAQTPASTGQ
ncbi:MAG: hypothetical protein AAGG07_14260 [Planctomycetota bacterium]